MQAVRDTTTVQKNTVHGPSHTGNLNHLYRAPSRMPAFPRWRSACSVQRMRWTPGGDSSDIEDRRGEGGGFNPGGFTGLHLGIGGTLVLIVLSVLFRTNLFSVLGGGGAA